MIGFVGTAGFLLDVAGATLPEGLRFFTPGWWVVHVLGIVLVFAFGYRKGRKDERRESAARTGS